MAGHGGRHRGGGGTRPAGQRAGAGPTELREHLVGEHGSLDGAALRGQHDGPVAVDHGRELVAADPVGQAGRGVQQLLGGLEVAERGVEGHLRPGGAESGGRIAIGLDQRLDAAPGVAEAARGHQQVEQQQRVPVAVADLAGGLGAGEQLQPTLEVGRGVGEALEPGQGGADHQQHGRHQPRLTLVGAELVEHRLAGAEHDLAVAAAEGLTEVEVGPTGDQHRSCLPVSHACGLSGRPAVRQVGVPVASGWVRWRRARRCHRR